MDSDVYTALKATGQFEDMSQDVDEEEHSLEMHLPYIVRVMRGHDFTLVPIMVGSLSPASEEKYGKV